MEREQIEIVGKKIVKLRRMTKKEMDSEGWDGVGPMVIELEGGIKLYPSIDEEGNGPGALFGYDKKGQFQLG